MTEADRAVQLEADRPDDARKAFEEAYHELAGVPATAVTATCAASRAHFLLLSSRHREAIPAALAAIELAQATDARNAEGRARITVGLSRIFDGELAVGAAEVKHGHELVSRWGDLDDRRRADSNVSYALLMAGQTAAACEVAVSGVARIRRNGLDAAAGAGLTANTIVLLRLAGRWSEAVALSDEVLGGELSIGSARFLLDRAELDIWVGNLNEARLHLDQARKLARWRC